MILRSFYSHIAKVVIAIELKEQSQMRNKFLTNYLTTLTVDVLAPLNLTM